MRTLFKVAMLSGLGALAVNQVSASLIIKGDFEAGMTGFTSEYVDVGGLATGGEWQQFTATFVPKADQSSGMSHLNESSRNDFAVNNITVPEPTTMLAGALLLLPFAVSTLRILRSGRAA